MDPSYWQGLYADYVTASAKCFGTAKSKNALLLAMSVAEHETNNGRAWPHTNNFGAVQLRSCTAAELDQIKAGTLKAGDTYAGSPGGVLHIDTHPVKGGSIPYPVWFVYFGDDRVSGIAYFLRTLLRLSAACLDADATCNAKDLCDQMYAHHYFEGFHPDDKPFQGVRSLPLDAIEQKTSDEYAGAVSACWTTISGALGTGDVNQEPSGPALN